MKMCFSKKFPPRPREGCYINPSEIYNIFSHLPLKSLAIETPSPMGIFHDLLPGSVHIYGATLKILGNQEAHLQYKIFESLFGKLSLNFFKS